MQLRYSARINLLRQAQYVLLPQFPMLWEFKKVCSWTISGRSDDVCDSKGLHPFGNFVHRFLELHACQHPNRGLECRIIGHRNTVLLLQFHEVPSIWLLMLEAIYSYSTPFWRDSALRCLPLAYLALFQQSILSDRCLCIRRIWPAGIVASWFVGMRMPKHSTSTCLIAFILFFGAWQGHTACILPHILAITSNYVRQCCIVLKQAVHKGCVSWFVVVNEWVSDWLVIKNSYRIFWVQACACRRTCILWI